MITYALPSKERVPWKFRLQTCQKTKVAILICFDFVVAICEAVGLGWGRMDRV